METLVSAHSCIFGSRYVGIHASTMKEWIALKGQYDSFFVIDDLVGHFTQPIDSNTYPDKAIVVARQFLQYGVHEGANIVLASGIPEIYELSLILASCVELDYLRTSYEASLLAVLSESQRRQLGLTAKTSIAEAFYPHLGISAYILGLETDVWQGGAEIAANFVVVNTILDGLRARNTNVQLPRPQLLLSTFDQVPGADGRYMTLGNCLSVDASEEEIVQYIASISNPAVVEYWCRIFGLNEVARKLQDDGKIGKSVRSRLTEAVVEELRPFRETRVTNGDALDVLLKGTQVARDKIASTLSEIRNGLGMGSYVSEFGLRT